MGSVVHFDGKISSIKKYPPTTHRIFTNDFFYYVLITSPEEFKGKTIMVTDLRGCFDFELSMGEEVKGRFTYKDNEVIHPILTNHRGK